MSLCLMTTDDSSAEEEVKQEEGGVGGWSFVLNLKESNSLTARVARSIQKVSNSLS